MLRGNAEMNGKFVPLKVVSSVFVVLFGALLITACAETNNTETQKIVIENPKFTTVGLSYKGEVILRDTTLVEIRNEALPLAPDYFFVDGDTIYINDPIKEVVQRYESGKRVESIPLNGDHPIYLSDKDDIPQPTYTGSADFIDVDLRDHSFVASGKDGVLFEITTPHDTSGIQEISRTSKSVYFYVSEIYYDESSGNISDRYVFEYSWSDGLTAAYALKTPWVHVPGREVFITDGKVYQLSIVEDAVEVLLLEKQTPPYETK
jgi:hypothetical protein